MKNIFKNTLVVLSLLIPSLLFPLRVLEFTREEYDKYRANEYKKGETSTRWYETGDTRVDLFYTQNVYDVGEDFMIPKDLFFMFLFQGKEKIKIVETGEYSYKIEGHTYSTDKYVAYGSSTTLGHLFYYGFDFGNPMEQLKEDCKYKKDVKQWLAAQIEAIANKDVRAKKLGKKNYVKKVVEWLNSYGVPQEKSSLEKILCYASLDEVILPVWSKTLMSLKDFESLVYAKATLDYINLAENFIYAVGNELKVEEFKKVLDYLFVVDFSVEQSKRMIENTLNSYKLYVLNPSSISIKYSKIGNSYVVSPGEEEEIAKIKEKHEKAMSFIREEWENNPIIILSNHTKQEEIERYMRIKEENEIRLREQFRLE